VVPHFILGHCPLQSVLSPEELSRVISGGEKGPSRDKKLSAILNEKECEGGSIGAIKSICKHQVTWVDWKAIFSEAMFFVPAAVVIFRLRDVSRSRDVNRQTLVHSSVHWRRPECDRKLWRYKKHYLWNEDSRLFFVESVSCMQPSSHCDHAIRLYTVNFKYFFQFLHFNGQFQRFFANKGWGRRLCPPGSAPVYALLFTGCADKRCAWSQTCEGFVNIALGQHSRTSNEISLRPSVHCCAFVNLWKIP
jgi:hypothetical protein